MPRIFSYGCTSSAGPDTASFWEGLRQGRDHSRAVSFPRVPGVAFTGQACIWSERSANECTRDFLAQKSLDAWNGALARLSPSARAEVPCDDRLGVIFASTKGCIDDFVWSDDGAIAGAAMDRDPYTDVLNAFLRAAEITTENRLSVSNACASSLSALKLASEWLAQKRVEMVLVIAADRVGPFVAQGFQSLQALTADRVRPFAKNRSGLRLGEAAAAILLSNDRGEFELEAVGIDAEGYAATRPSESGESLGRACQALGLANFGDTVDFVIAHGTATQINDLAEARALARLFAERGRHHPIGAVPITATKGSIGHTLGVSGAMDVIAACEALRAQALFSITNHDETDPSFEGVNLRFLSASAGSIPDINGLPGLILRRALITSLGFGGIHAAATVRLA